MDRSRADYMGMLGTVMNCLALQDFLREGGHRDPGADRDHDGPGRRALHPAPRDPAPREGPRRHLRRRPRGAVLLHRHHGRPARARDRLRGRAHGQGRRRRVRPTTPARTPTRSASRPSPTPRCSPAGCKVADATAFSLCMDNRPADHRVQPARRGQHRPRRAGERIGTLVATLTPSAATAQARRATRSTRDRRDPASRPRRRWRRPSAVAKEDFAGIRTGRANPGDVRQDHGRLLRLA